MTHTTKHPSLFGSTGFSISKLLVCISRSSSPATPSAWSWPPSAASSPRAPRSARTIRSALFGVAVLLFLGEWAGAQTPPLLPAAGQWGIVSCNTLQDVLWRDGTGLTVTWLKGGVADDENYFIAWNGGTYHPEQRKFIYAAQGGDSNGADNGIYAFDFASCLHSRIFGPTVNLIPDAEVNSGTWPYVDTAGIYGPAGKAYPQARETYGGECAIPGVGAWVSGGVPWHVYEIIQTSIQSIWYATPTGWQGPFDANGSWYENWCVWDSIQNRVVYQDYSRLRAYYPSAPVGSRGG